MLTADELRRLIRYDPATGSFTRRVRMGQYPEGSTAGTVASVGYIRFCVSGRYYLAHRLAFLYMTGRWPAALVDHVNGDPLDNRWANLRQADDTENARNRRVRSDSRTGVKGVALRGRRYAARINHHGTTTFLGYFATVADASAAYEAAARQLFGAFAKRS